jgi:hypothetical protein
MWAIAAPAFEASSTDAANVFESANLAGTPGCIDVSAAQLVMMSLSMNILP